MATKAYRDAHKAENVAGSRAWRLANPERRKANRKAEYWADPVAARAATRAWALANPERAKQGKRSWASSHPENVRASSRKHRLKTKEKQRIQTRTWRAAHPDLVHIQKNRRRARLAGAVGSYSVQEWLALLESFGGKCGYCGSEVGIHPEHRQPLSRGGSNDIANIIPACRPCNSWKNVKTEAEFRAVMASCKTT